MSNDRDNEKRERVPRKDRSVKMPEYMANKLAVFYIFVLLAFAFLMARVLKISSEDSEEYKKQVLSQQNYDSKTIPFKRGSIIDRNGVTLAYSAQVFNIILDSKLLLKSPEDIDATLVALQTCFGIDPSTVRQVMAQYPESSYRPLLKQVPYEQVQQYIELRDEDESGISKRGVWFESEYKRQYPYGSLGADIIGFTTGDNIGMYGLEEYYNDTLSGSDGREYGYLTDDNALERTTIPATNGYNIVSTVDAYIQGICEENIIKFNEDHANEYREGDMGSDNTGVIIMDVNTGEILAMASYPTFDLNNPYDVSAYYTDEEIAIMEEEKGNLAAQDTIWKNFCISQSYEPGSVCKTFTMAAGLDSGAIHDGDTFFCGGFLKFGEGDTGATIRCHNRYGEGTITIKTALEQSCNVVLMQIGQKMGVKTYLKYFSNFNFGLKTNIDLSGEMRTASLVFNEKSMGPTELATSTFGQGFNVTMIQTISAYCSLVNGGYYFKPHMVSKIVDENGTTVVNCEPVMLRQTVSEKVSDTMIDYCIGVVEEGTGKYARPAGYKIGGKTGTAEHSGGGKIDYVVSFMGFAPADDPQIAIYVVIDRPNTATQDTATRYACLLCRSILTDVLPYLNIYMTEELSDKEKQELEEHGSHVFSLSNNAVSENSASENSAVASGLDGIDNVSIEIANPDVVIDKKTGYAIDPVNGEYLDPATGQPINSESSIFQDNNGASVEHKTITSEEESNEEWEQ